MGLAERQSVEVSVTWLRNRVKTEKIRLIGIFTTVVFEALEFTKKKGCAKKKQRLTLEHFKGKRRQCS